MIPIISGTVAGQSVSAGSTIDPFASVAVVDPNDFVNNVNLTITLTDANGNATDANGTLSIPSGDLGADTFTEVSAGVYVLSNGSAPGPATTAPFFQPQLADLMFTPTNTATTRMTLTETNGYNETQTDSSTTVTAGSGYYTAPAPAAVIDTSTPPVSTDTSTPPVSTDTSTPPVSTDPSTPPVSTDASTPPVSTDPSTPPVSTDPSTPPVTSDTIDASSSNVNATTPPPDPLINGTTVLDGSTAADGSSAIFLIGATRTGTFVVDERASSSDPWTQVSTFGAGDSITIVGVTPADFEVTRGHSHAPGGITGSVLDVSAAGYPNLTTTPPTSDQTVPVLHGKLAVSFGSESDGTPYLVVHAPS